jgi:hypothetical protein
VVNGRKTKATSKTDEEAGGTLSKFHADLDSPPPHKRGFSQFHF